MQTNYDIVIGLEVHCQLKTKSKLFCKCQNSFGSDANLNTCPVCLGYPGSLPVLNRQAVDFAILLACALNMNIRKKSVFARKQYFYPDLPKGYQITQFDLPYAEHGFLEISAKNIAIDRIHLEEDAGKCTHSGSSSYIDLNRAGTPLVEIVTAPCLSTPAEATEYLKNLHRVIRYLDVSDGNMEEGSFRCDANISLKPKGSTTLGVKCEIKNVNSFRNIERAIAYEILRQADTLDTGGKIIQQTMQFDEASGKTTAMRTKEDSHDYRYFPDPDLGPLVIDDDRIAKLRAQLPEMAAERFLRYQEEYGLSTYDAEQLSAERPLADYFERVLKKLGQAEQAKLVANWILTDVRKLANQFHWSFSEPKVSSESLGELLLYLVNGQISGKIAKTIWQEMNETGASAELIVKEKNLVQVSDEHLILNLVTQILDQNPEQLAEFLGGKTKVLGFFIGKIMRESKGKMNPESVNRILNAEIEKRR